MLLRNLTFVPLVKIRVRMSLGCERLSKVNLLVEKWEKKSISSH